MRSFIEYSKNLKIRRNMYSFLFFFSNFFRQYGVKKWTLFEVYFLFAGSKGVLKGTRTGMEQETFVSSLKRKYVTRDKGYGRSSLKIFRADTTRMRRNTFYSTYLSLSTTYNSYRRQKKIINRPEDN